MKKKIFLILPIITLIFFISVNTRAQDVNLDTLIDTNNYNSNATRLIINSEKNLNKLNMLNMPNLTQVNISGINISNSSVIHFKNKIKLLYLKNVVINMDGIYDNNIEKIEIRNSYIYGNSSKTNNYKKISKLGANYIENTSYNSEINKIAQSIYKSGMSKEDIIREVTLYVTNHITYNLDAAGEESDYAANSLRGQGVCGEYAYLESQLLNRLGIFTLTIYGYPTDSSTYHAWNVVYLNNKWYTIDPTWLDTKGNKNTYEPNNERYKKYYLKPVNANIYKPDFTLYNSIPLSERVSKSIIQTNNVNNHTNKNSNSNSSSITNYNNNNNSTNKNTVTNNNTNTNESNTSNSLTNNNLTINNEEKNLNNNNNNNIINEIKENDTNTTQNEIIEPDNNTEITDSEIITNDNIKDNNIDKENNENTNINNNDTNIFNEVEIPDTDSNNILFIILGILILIFGISFIKEKKEN